jgi:hypothetical protein
MYKLPDIPSGGPPCELSAAIYLRIKGTCEKFENMQVSGLFMFDSASGRLLSAPTVNIIQVRAKITSTTSNGAIYNAKTITGAINSAVSANLAMADLGTLSSSENLIVWNLTEIGSSLHTINISDNDQCVFSGSIVGLDTGTGFPIMLIKSPAWFQVAVTNDGGSNGTSTTPPSYTYTVKTPDAVTTLGTAMTPVKARHNGKYTAGSGVGWAYISSGTLYLWDANEFEGIKACSP